MVKKNIENKFGPTVIFSGDDIRKIFKLKGFTRENRIKYLEMYHEICKNIINQNINVIFAVVGLFEFIRKKNTKNIKNYIEIFIDTKLEKIIMNKAKKKVYKKKKNIVGKDIKAEFPKNPDIILKNNFDRSMNDIKGELLRKINKLNILIK